MSIVTAKTAGLDEARGKGEELSLAQAVFLPSLLSGCELVPAILPTPCSVLCCGGPKFRNSYPKDTFPSVRCPQRTLCHSNTGKTRSLVKRQWHSMPVGAYFYSVT